MYSDRVPPLLWVSLGLFGDGAAWTVFCGCFHTGFWGVIGHAFWAGFEGVQGLERRCCNPTKNQWADMVNQGILVGGEGSESSPKSGACGSGWPSHRGPRRSTPRSWSSLVARKWPQRAISVFHTEIPRRILPKIGLMRHRAAQGCNHLAQQQFTSGRRPDESSRNRTGVCGFGARHSAVELGPCFLSIQEGWMGVDPQNALSTRPPESKWGALSCSVPPPLYVPGTSPGT